MAHLGELNYVMKHVTALVLGVLILPGWFYESAQGQASRIKLGPAFCSMDPVDQAGAREVESQEPDKQTVNMIARIVGAAGVEQNFVVKEYNVFNAEAQIVDEGDQPRRYIFYNRGFLDSIRESGGSEWAEIGIMAHEVAHHLNGHIVENSFSTRELELEADKSAGFWMERMGATLAQAQSGFSGFPDVVPPGSSHPRRKDRLEAVEAGWRSGPVAELRGRITELEREGYRFEPIQFNLLDTRCKLAQVYITNEKAENTYVCESRYLSEAESDRHANNLDAMLRMAVNGQTELPMDGPNKQFDVSDKYRKLKAVEVNRSRHLNPTAYLTNLRLKFVWEGPYSRPYSITSQRRNMRTSIEKFAGAIESKRLELERGPFVPKTSPTLPFCNSELERHQRLAQMEKPDAGVSFECSSKVFAPAEFVEKDLLLREISESIEVAMKPSTVSWSFAWGDAYYGGGEKRFSFYYSPMRTGRNEVTNVVVSEKSDGTLRFAYEFSSRGPDGINGSARR